CLNPVGNDIAHFEDPAHAAASQQGDDLVVAYRFADLKICRGQRNTLKFREHYKANPCGFAAAARRLTDYCREADAPAASSRRTLKNPAAACSSESASSGTVAA